MTERRENGYIIRTYDNGTEIRMLETATTTPTEPEPQPEVSLQELAENQMIIMQALADLYEGGASRG